MKQTFGRFVFYFLFIFLVGSGSLAFLAILPSRAVAQLMVVPGKYDVTPAGSAAFSVPVSVPPGTAGMVPALSIDYTSGGGNGTIGVGWSVSGLGAITRCPQTQAQDGDRGSVTYDVGLSGPPDNDRFCLSGQRLILVSGSSYGAAGSTYRTEIESFANIVASSTLIGNSPAYFTVYTKSGQIMEFGNTATSTNSAAKLSGISSVASWLLDKVSDTAGNYMTIQYNNYTTSYPTGLGLPSNNEYEPAEIDYTGNPGGLGSNGTNYPSVAPYNKVTFVYASGRTDIVPHFIAGALVETTQSLTDIETWAGSTEVADYKFAPITSTATGKNVLNTITLCDATGSNCVPARTFTAQAGGPLPSSGVNGNFGGLNGSYSGYQIYPADFVGSGADGALLVPSNCTNSYCGLATGSSLEVLLNKGGTITPVAATATYPSVENATTLASSITGCAPTFCDFDGDGKSDVFWTCDSSYDYVWLSNGDGTFSVVSNPVSFSGMVVNKAVTGDFNGDGKSDLLLYFALPSGQVGQQLTDQAHPPDGIFVTSKASIETTYSQCTGPSACSFSSPVGEEWTAEGVNQSVNTAVYGYKPYLVDMNGDGKADIYWEPEDIYGRVSNSPGTTWFSPITFSGAGTIASGTVSSPSSPLSLSSQFGYSPSFGDFNGDGLPDIFFNATDTSGRSTGGGALFLNEGTVGSGSSPTLSFDELPISSSLMNGVAGYRADAADFNGDGMSDLLWDKENTDGGTEASRAIWTSNGSGFNTSAYGATTNVASKNGSFNDTDDTDSSSDFHPIVGDFNGDAKADILWDDYSTIGDSQGTRMLWSSDAIQPDLLTSLTNGIGASTSIAYGTPPEGWNTYYAGWPSTTCTASPAVAPTIDLALPVPVVIASYSSTGVGSSTYNSSYTYSCMRADTTGRGMLGFTVESVTDPQTGIVQITNFDQTFPYIGQIATQTKQLTVASQTVTLSSTANTYQSLTPSAGSNPLLSCTGASQAALPALPWSGPGSPAEVAPVFPFLAQSVIAANDLAETTAPTISALPTATTGPTVPTSLPATPPALPTATSTTTYDNYGNALTVCTSKKQGTTQGSTQSTTNSYYAPVTTSPPWLLGRLQTSTVTSTTP